MNIKSRLTLLFTMLVGSIMALFCIAIYFFYDQYREKQFYSFLNERGQTIAQLVEASQGISKADIEKIEKANNAILLNEEITIYDGSDSLIFTSGDEKFTLSKNILAEARGGKEIRTKHDNKEAIIIRHVLQDHRKPWVVMAVANDFPGMNQLKRLREILLIGWLLSLILVGVAGWQFANDAIKPVSDIISQVNNISAGNLHEKVTVGREKDELAALAQTFNQMLSRLEIAFIAQKNFVSHASHELRTPLALIMSEAELSLMKDRPTEEYKDALRGIWSEAREMNELVSRLLELARTEEHAFRVTFSKIRVDEVLWQAKASVQQKNPGYKVHIHYDNIPDDEEQLKRYGDESLLKTAFMNLMDNACKYSNDGTVNVFLEIHKDLIKIFFKDVGIGIAPDELPYIFDTFYRSATTISKAGYGIGLALTKRIINMQGASIEVESVMGSGTTFILKFPPF
ncbi:MULTISPECIES: HAMP domain-containing sensor histidine kinase [Dyadobacter]|uniref:histidine kinase n=1 Tax=Dyadobacter chenhuakuii TaxID=2909339 RepID=A0A9X1QJE0_9BACT|nr:MULTISPECIES: HAMP domain-containing sensor histidine kinase [Dyadobacter]MCE7071405.1 HAMP domain-containing histidine kinase [Dyadobacter sp. CY327]MCF2493708.1 HAMP domain-containing histidine kinase [Dyadobacter chenhuakuii]MCF2500779.1 HAMP domain-containing histidine kinase [Dyadobacter chenhuakuii]MCF2517957.1 HAMP domain-containing histidine kinase [Dyadobacter sp. CY351]USJ30843.1 HAMP domain-containing histidine kinase [Dyadobacter chenhuakuii]